MGRKITSDEAREMSLGRRTVERTGGRHGGRRPKPRHCAKCGQLCDSASTARAHCVVVDSCQQTIIGDLPD